MSDERGSEPVIVTSQALRDWPLPRVGEGGKESRGSVAVIGGAHHTPGAVLLAGVAALRTGAGKLTVGTVERNAPALGVAVPEAGVQSLPETDAGVLGRAAVEAAAELVESVDAIVLGPGMAGPDAAKELLTELLPRIGD